MYDEQTFPLETYASEWDHGAGSTPDAGRRCRALAASIGASGFGLLLLARQEDGRQPTAGDGDLPDLRELISPRDADDLARAAMEAMEPVWWSAGAGEPPLCAEARAWARNIAIEAGSAAGIAFPVSLECGRAGLFVFTGDEIALDLDRLCDVHSDCFALFAELPGGKHPADAKTPTLSKRELECLRLTADGLTSDDISTALGLSIHTANQYLTNSTHKLNAVNRIHAVAKAIRGGLID